MKGTNPRADTRGQDDEARFALWMRLVDAEIARRCGFTSGDLPDCCYRDWFDDDMSAKEAARMAIANAA